MSMDQPDEEFIDQAEVLQEIIASEIWPALSDLDEAFPEQSAFFNIFIDSIHVLRAQGWTKEELLKEVEEHSELFEKNELPGEDDIVH